jgi:nitrite reductase/ring-hydroxylating ferredoxin subunit
METGLISTKEIPKGKMIGVERNGQAILIANVNGAYYAMGDICTHMGCNISGGILNGEKVQCPCHGSTFDVRTGAVLKGPADRPELSYKVKVNGTQISIEV